MNMVRWLRCQRPKEKFFNSQENFVNMLPKPCILRFVLIIMCVYPLRHGVHLSGSWHANQDIWMIYAIFVRIVRIYGQKMVKKSQNQDILHFVIHCVRMMSGYFRNFNPPSPRSAPFSYLINIVTFDVCWGVSDYIVQSSICSYLYDIDD